MENVVEKVAKEFKEELKKLYGEELSALILFGSHARQEANPESDIDFAVVLKNPSTTSTSEIFKISYITQAIGVKYGQLVSYIGMPEDKYRNSSFGIYQEIRKDGVVI